ncbi:MAG: hypothetical protein V3U64_05095 [Cocleimonas sp.]
MLNKIILNTISKHSLQESQAMLADIFEKPATYTGWVYPFRYLLALRYLKQKKTILAKFRADDVYPVFNDDFHSALTTQLSGSTEYITRKKNKNPFSSLGFKSYVFYPALIAGLLLALFSTNSWYQQRRIENVLANHLPYYSDLLHRKLLLTHNKGSSAHLGKIDVIISQQQAKILSDLPKNNGIRKIMEEQLEKLKNTSTSSEEIMLGFKAVNTLFDEKSLPYYLSPKSFSLPCSSLIDAPVEEMMMLKKLESLMSNNNPEPCRTTMMTAYKVSKRNQLFYQDSKSSSTEKIELPLFHVKRIDKVPAADSALGLTFKDHGIGSIILTERIENFSRESVLPALTFQGRNYIIPYWMQGYYEIEEAVTKGYKKDLNKIYPKKVDRLKVKVAIKKLIKDKSRMQNSKLQQTLGRTNTNDNKSLFGNGFDAISVLLGKQNKESEANHDKNKRAVVLKLDESELTLLDKLDAVLLPSIEYHEAYHQIDKKEWATPAWTKTLFKDENLTENGLEHTMEELGAYLAQMANTEEGHNIWLSKLLMFSLSPFTKGQAEYYASSIILTTMESIFNKKKISPFFIVDVERKTKIYNTLINLSNAKKRELARKSYRILFNRKAPMLNQ